MIPVIGRTAWTGNIREGFELLEGQEWTAHALPNGGCFNLPPVGVGDAGYRGIHYLGEVAWGVSETFIRTHVIVIRFDDGGTWHAPFRLEDKDGEVAPWLGGEGNDGGRFICANASFQVHPGPSVSRFIIGAFPEDYLNAAAYVEPGVSDGILTFHTEKKPVLVFTVREFRHHKGGLVDELR